MIINDPIDGRQVIPSFNRWGKAFRSSRPWNLPNEPFGFVSAFGACGGVVALAWVRSGGSVGTYHYGSFFCPAGNDVAYGPDLSISGPFANALQNPPAGGPINGLTGGRLFNSLVRNTPYAFKLG